MTILEYRMSGGVLDTGMGALGIYEEDPRNHWQGSFFDRLYEWMPVEDKPGLYWNTSGNTALKDYYYTYEYNSDLGAHTMVPTQEKTPWHGVWRK